MIDSETFSWRDITKYGNCVENDREKRISDNRMEELVKDIAFYDTVVIPRYIEILLNEIFETLTSEKESKETILLKQETGGRCQA